MNVEVIERRLIDELDDDTDESIEGSPRRISAPEIATEMNNRLANHLRVSAERNGVDLGPRKDLAASLAGPYLAAPYLAAPYLAEPYLGHKKRADSSGRENTFVADKVRELDDSAADSRPDLPCKLDGKLDGKLDCKLDCKLDSQSEQGEPSKGTALQATADAVLDLLNLEAEIIREGSDEPLCKKRRLLNNKMKVALAEGTRAQAENIRAQAENIRALVEICRESMQLV
jgi:hypothetical protein